jgi:TPR repeat protein
MIWVRQARGLALAAGVAALALGGPALAQTEGERLMTQAMEQAKSDPVGALATMRRAAATGDLEAINALGVFRIQGVGAPADTAEGLKLWEEAADKGAKGARVNLGRLWLADPDPRNDAKAFGYAEPLLEDPKVRSAVLYPAGRALIFGFGTPRDLNRGVALLVEAEAHEEDNADLLFLLARGYQAGWGGLTVDPARSTAYFRRAAVMGDERAQWYYGMALLNGQGTPVNAREAWRWVKASADQGYIFGMNSAGVMLAIGQGVAEDDAQARVWYEKAARAGSTHGMGSLAMMLMTGEGGAVDEVTGQAYLELAMEAGGDRPKAMLSRFGITPTPEQRKRIDRIKADWKRTARPLNPES